MSRETVPFEQVRRPVEALIPYHRNARVHSDAQVATIAASIREFGFANPVLIDEAENVIAGHGRLMAARKLGMADIPCVVVTGLSEAQRRALVLADNRIALSSSWDNETLALELADLSESGFSLELTGFGGDELQVLFGEQADAPASDPADAEDNYSEQYGVIVMCSSAATQEDAYNRLKELGYEVKVVTT